MALPIDQLRKIRLEKLRKIKDLGIDPFPPRCLRQQTTLEALKMIGKKVAVAGRIMAIRGHGGIQFADLCDESAKIQLVFKKNQLSIINYQLSILLDIGDFLAAQGEVFKTKAGEISVLVEDFQILAKSLRPLPSKWYGLKDVEERYRKRYLDLIMNRKVKETFILRTKIISAVREFLDKQGFLEVETPTLQEIYGGAAARPFITHHNALDSDFYLKISDELYLKRLIIGGFEKVYEIDKDFRNEGIDRMHNPEFTMMECYWAYADYHNMMKLTEDLFNFVVKKVLGTTKINFGEHKIDFKPPWRRLTMKEGLKEYAKVDIDKLTDEEIKNLLKKHNLIAEEKPTLSGVAAGFNRGVAIATLFELVEPHLIQPTFVTDFPKETTALCKPKPQDPSLIERFEPYIAGFEVGNAYSELNDPLLQREFFQQQVKAAKSGDEEAHPMDEQFLEAMEYGMPPTGGLGIGIDRMVMLLTNNQNIRDVILFPTLKPKR
ncbi:MAG: lysine--tRNA ligase [Microgenomates group bacterium]